MTPPPTRPGPPTAPRPRDGAAPPPAATLPRDLRLRPPEPADGIAVRRLVAACERTYLEWAPPGWTVPEVPSEWPWPGHWSLAACDSAAALVGLVAFRRARAEEAPGVPAGAPLAGVAHLAALYVAPSRRRQGVGAALLSRAEGAMRSRGHRAARLWTPEGAPAERFYAAQGWRRDGRSGWDAWLGLAMVGYAKRL